MNANMLWFICMQYQYMPSSCLFELVLWYFLYMCFTIHQNMFILEMLLSKACYK